MMLPWVVAWCGLVCLAFRTSLASSRFILPIWRLAIAASQTIVNIKLTFELLGENTLYVDIGCDAALTSLPSPAYRRSCGLVLASATTSEELVAVSVDGVMV